MARSCMICRKQTVSGNAVSHSNVKVRRTWKANLQRVRVLVNGAPQRAYVCAKCLKAGKAQRAV